MGMGTRQSQQYQDQLWGPAVDMVRSPGHPFYQRLNAYLDGEGFDAFVEGEVSESTIWREEWEECVCVVSRPPCSQLLNH
jgi:hypothetical protein